ncbi:hypothetical protein TNCV_1403941 [Trichonephila clavipes]|nr:hypothetical protein TNCV_1403941 [Trichonephila clavipes]
MKRKENFQWLPKELHQLKYEAISVPQGSVRLVKKTQERKSSTCYLLITKVPTSREDARFGVIGKVLPFVRNGRYPERTFLPSFIGDPVHDSDEDLRLAASDCEESEESADEIDNIPVNSDIISLEMAQNGYRMTLMFLAYL